MSPRLTNFYLFYSRSKVNLLQAGKSMGLANYLTEHAFAEERL